MAQSMSRILIVDDEVNNRLLLEIMLERLGISRPIYWPLMPPFETIRKMEEKTGEVKSCSDGLNELSDNLKQTVHLFKI